MTRVAAVQLDATIADVGANLAACERLADAAAAAGAAVIALPEFFSTGIGFVPELAGCALPPDGVATQLLTRLAARHDAIVSGSFLCRDADGHVRNAYVVATPDGVAGRHDKDLPTMWESSFYVGGAGDDGVIRAGGLTIGAAMCWELMRTQTVRRLRGRIDLALTGSGWWSIPGWAPQALFGPMETRNSARARTAAATFARYVGAPVVHAAHAGNLRCRFPWLPGVGYSGHFEGATLITDATGQVLAERSWHDGEGLVTAEVEPARSAPTAEPPDRFWLHARGALASLAWNYQRVHGRRWYARNVEGTTR